MTCIVAEVVKGVVHMAGDKLGSNGYSKMLVSKSKVFIKGEFIIGYTSSFRMGQLLEYTWTPPEKLTSQAEELYIYKTVVDSVKETLKADGYATDKSGGTFLFGYKGSIYEMQDDFAIFKAEKYTAVGCGEQEAKAVLYTLDKVKSTMSIEKRLALAIEASSVLKCGVSSEYDYLKL